MYIILSLNRKTYVYENLAKVAKLAFAECKWKLKNSYLWLDEWYVVYL